VSHSLIADLLLVIHFLFIAFILVGQALILIGYFKNWNWVRHLIFRICHILAITVVVVQAWLNQICPLTIWESALRKTAGEPPYSGTFVQHWIGQIVYYDAPQWVFTVAYSLFGALVLISWCLVRPER